MTTDWNAFCKERSNHLRERIEAEEKRVKELEKNSVKLSELSVQMGEILKYHQQQINEQEGRLEKIEQRPGKLGETFRAAFVSACVSGFVTYLIAHLTTV